MEVLVFVAIAVAGITALVVYAVRAEKQRTADLEAAAAQLGWGFRKEVPYDAIPNLDRFELLASGRRRTLKNLLTSPPGEQRAVIFDYSYVTGGGKSQQTHRQTVFLAAADRIDLPVFSLRPEHAFHRVAAMLGYQDIDLESRPEFSRQFLLRGENEAQVREAFTDAVAEFFEQRPRTCAAGGGHELLFWRPGRFVKPDELPAFVQDGLELVARIMGAWERGSVRA